MSAEQPQVLFLNRSYWPDVEATGQLLTELCESLSSDFDVQVVAGKPNQVKDAIEESGWQNKLHHNGVGIHRVRHLQLPKHRMVAKGLNYLSFVRGIRRKLRQISLPDIVVFETDPFLLPIEADRLRQRTGCRTIGYLQDIYPDLAVALNKVPNNWLIQRLRKKLFSVYQRCDRMVVLSEDMKRLLIAGGVRAERIDVVPNWADPALIFPVQKSNSFRTRHGLEHRFVVMYSGNIGLTQRLEEFVEAAELLGDLPEVIFLFVGQGSQRKSLESLVKQKSLTNVRFLDYQPKSELATSLGAADLHLVPLTRELSQCLMPSKLYGILAAGRPYLTNAVPECELHRITSQYKVGLTVEPGSPAAIAMAIRSVVSSPSLLEEMGRNARSLALTEYTREKSVAKFRQLLQKVMENGSSGD